MSAWSQHTQGCAPRTLSYERLKHPMLQSRETSSQYVYFSGLGSPIRSLPHHINCGWGMETWRNWGGQLPDWLMNIMTSTEWLVVAIRERITKLGLYDNFLTGFEQPAVVLKSTTTDGGIQFHQVLWCSIGSPTIYGGIPEQICRADLPNYIHISNNLDVPIPHCISELGVKINWGVLCPYPWQTALSLRRSANCTTLEDLDLGENAILGMPNGYLLQNEGYDYSIPIKTKATRCCTRRCSLCFDKDSRDRGELRRLQPINLFNNDLEGGIPSSLAKVRDPESLDLWMKMLSRRIHRSWQSLRILRSSMSHTVFLPVPYQRGDSSLHLTAVLFMGTYDCVDILNLTEKCGNADKEPMLLNSKGIHMIEREEIFHSLALWFDTCRGLLYQYLATYAYLAYHGIGAIQLGLGDV
ncbi:LOW QUALITY PROTEIN: hypothetical protein Cgig2_014263 [Carnegiea gigantea]|uniref:Uncharacterized protein n=1 Tax=Carnegiea gigantea TaxID=171969 RepID=A0A9Q1K2X9_9CARY|nr:LOW QUALITY PROTEIN: hypothetical protein Cgig2_014263 [Carnegiea gigantea]